MELRRYQREAVDAIPAFFQVNKTGNPLVICPTASGKSVIQAAFIKYAFQYPGQRWLLLSHVMELIAQNFERLMQVWPGAPAGIYCAQLKRKETDKPITVASIQSIYKVAYLFGHIDGIIIDEAHLLSDKQDGMYRLLISNLQAVNPRLKVIGLTATPFRLKSGMLTTGKNRIFTDIAYEIPITTLLKEGWIANLKSKPSKNQVDLSDIKTVGGEFSAPEMEAKLNTHEITDMALNEVCELGQERRSWIIFCAGKDHAFAVRDNLRGRGITAETVTGDTPKNERERILQDYKAGKIRAVTNVSVLTTGFDAPGIDLVVLLRGTKSAGLYIQICGRGMRLNGRNLSDSIANGKADCLILDYCGNIKRFGPINLIKPIPQADMKKQGGGDGIGRPPIKQCPQCLEVQSIFQATCLDCGFQFPIKGAEHETSAASGDIFTDEYLEDQPIQNLNVDRVAYSEHITKAGQITMRVDYHCGLSKISEYIGFENPKTARMAMVWWKSRAINKYFDSPQTAAHALARKDELKTPEVIAVKRNKKYFDVVGVVKYRDPLEATG